MADNRSVIFDFSQDSILSKLAEYLVAENRDPIFMKKIKEEGFCWGFKWVVLLAIALEFEPKTSEAPRDDWTWLKGIFERLLSWQGDSKDLTIQDKNDFDRLIALIESHQNPQEYFSQLGQYKIDELYSDTKGRKLKKEYPLTGFFTKDDLNLILPHLLKEDRILSISSHNHGAGVFTKRGNHFYDSNDKSGPKTLSLDGLVKHILTATDYPYDILSPFGFCTYTFSDKRAQYPRQEELLNLTTVIKHKEKFREINLNHADNYSVLHFAAITGDTASLYFYLKQGLACHGVNKEKQTPLNIAISEKHYDCVKHLALATATLKNGNEIIQGILLQAIKDQDLNIVKIILETSLNDFSYAILEQVFFLAVQLNDLELIEKMLKADVDIDARNVDGLTAFEIAEKNRSFDVMDKLLKNGVEIKTGQNRMSLQRLQDHHSDALINIIDGIDKLNLNHDKPDEVEQKEVTTKSYRSKQKIFLFYQNDPYSAEINESVAKKQRKM